MKKRRRRTIRKRKLNIERKAMIGKMMNKNMKTTTSRLKKSNPRMMVKSIQQHEMKKEKWDLINKQKPIWTLDTSGVTEDE